MVYRSMEEIPRTLTVDEAGQRLRIGRNNMYRLVNSGQIQSIKVGRKILIPRNALVRFLSAFDQAS